MTERPGRPLRQAARWLALAVGVAIAMAGLTWLGAPSPALFAGLLGALVFALLNQVPLAVHPTWFKAAQSVIGAAVAVQIDLQALRDLGSDGAPLVLIIAGTLVASVLCGQLLRLHQVSTVTASFSSVAGGASGMIALAHDFGADERVVMIVQYLRVLFILATLPLVVSIAFTPGADSAATAVVSSTSGSSLNDYLFLLVALTVGPAFAVLVRLPSAALLGPMLVGIALAATPAFGDAVVPAWVQAGAFLLIGAQVGLRFTRESLRAMGRLMPTALLVTVLSIAACGALGLLLAAVSGESRLDAYLATTPGGLPAVLATSTETAGNVTFVTAAQSVRLLLVLLLAPFAARVLFRAHRTS